MNNVLQRERFCMNAGGEVYFGILPAGKPDVHDLIVSGQLEKALSAVSKGAGGRVLDEVRGDPVRPQTVPIPKILIKSKTWSGHPIRKRLTFRGLNISIENPAGTYRTGKDPDGNEWRSLLHFDYGYIRGTTGVDKDHVDCFIGPEPNSEKVYVIHQKDVKTGKYDEDKCMLGWSTRAGALKDYLKNYDRRDMIMGCTTMKFDEFKKKVLATAHKPQMIKAVIRAHQRKTGSGKIVNVKQHVDSRTTKEEKFTGDIPASKVATGKPITFNYIHNPISAPKSGTTFAQDIEPGGMYVVPGTPSKTMPHLETGAIHFKNPLVMENITPRHGGWKTNLSEKFGGKKGKALTAAILKAGYDGVITTDTKRNYVTEIVALDPSTAILQGMHQKSVAAEGKYRTWLRNNPEAVAEAEKLAAEIRRLRKMPHNPTPEYLKSVSKRAQELKRRFESKWTTIYSQQLQKKPIMNKAHVKAHPRLTRSGKIVQVREHEDIRGERKLLYIQKKGYYRVFDPQGSGKPISKYRKLKDLQLAHPEAKPTQKEAHRQHLQTPEGQQQRKRQEHVIFEREEKREKHITELYEKFKADLQPNPSARAWGAKTMANVIKKVTSALGGAGIEHKVSGYAGIDKNSSTYIKIARAEGDDIVVRVSNHLPTMNPMYGHPVGGYYLQYGDTDARFAAADYYLLPGGKYSAQQIINKIIMKKSIMNKAHVKAHTRKMKSGKITQVREHEDKREKHGKNTIEITRKAGTIGEVKRAITNYRKSPGDLQLAVRAAVAYARKGNEDMIVVEGNSFMNKIYRIIRATGDIRSITVMNMDTYVVLAKPNGEVFDAVVKKRN